MARKRRTSPGCITCGWMEKGTGRRSETYRGLAMSRGNRITTALLALAGIAWLPSAARSQSQTSGRPNVILIVADDLGYGELTCQGYTKEIPTPNIDSIARSGVRFTNGYVSCPVCSPTRAGLLTGRYQQRFGHEFNPGGAIRAPVQFGLPLTETTLPERLKK